MYSHILPPCFQRTLCTPAKMLKIMDDPLHNITAYFIKHCHQCYVILIPQAQVHCLICTHKPEAHKPKGACLYIRQNTSACGITAMYHSPYRWNGLRQMLTIKCGAPQQRFLFILHVPLTTLPESNATINTSSVH